MVGVVIPLWRSPATGFGLAGLRMICTVNAVAERDLFDHTLICVHTLYNLYYYIHVGMNVSLSSPPQSETWSALGSKKAAEEVD